MTRDLVERVATALNGGPDELMDLTLELRGSPARGPHSWAADRFGLLKRLVLAPWRVRRNAKPLASSVIVFDVGLSPEYQEHRSAFVRTHFGQKVDFVSAATPRIAEGGRAEWSRWYRFGLGIALRGLFDFSPKRYFWLGQQLLEIQALALASSGIERAFVFRLFDRRPYLAATYLARQTPAEVLCVFQNIPLWRNCRFFHIGTPVVVTSKVNVPEVEWLSAQGWFKTSEVLYRSQEFVGAMPSPVESTIDIGFISSGEWARREGLYQITDIERVRAGEFLDNPYAEKSAQIAAELARYAHERGLTLRIYPHPYERRLAAVHGIHAPWESLVDGLTVTVAADGYDSRSTIYEPRVAVAVQSSFIWERLDLGLEESYIFDFEDDETNVFKRESLGRYSDNVFASAQELCAKLDRAFGQAEPD